jgi:hypothetical protein
VIFLPYLPCKNCVGRIELPLSIQSETTPSQIAWPWGALSGTFLCPSCMRLSLYWAEDCRWNPVRSMFRYLQTIDLAVHQIDIPCVEERCPGLLHILAVMRLGSHRDDASGLAARIYLLGAPCDNGQVPRPDAHRDARAGHARRLGAGSRHYASDAGLPHRSQWHLPKRGPGLPRAVGFDRVEARAIWSGSPNGIGLVSSTHSIDSPQVTTSEPIRLCLP